MMGMERDQLMSGFDMKLPQRNFSHKVVLDALGDIHKSSSPCEEEFDLKFVRYPFG